MDSDVPSESKPRHPDPLSPLPDSTVSNGCVIRRPTPQVEEVADDCDSDRVGVLDYMPTSRHAATFDASPVVARHRLRLDASPAESSFDVTTTSVSRHVEPKNIELTTFRITECHDTRRGPVTCTSCASDDELLGAESEDFLHEVVVVKSSSEVPVDRAERSGSVISGVEPTIIRSIPSSCGGTSRDGAWSRSESPPPVVDGAGLVDCDLEEDMFTTTFRGSVEREGGCVAMTTEEERDEEALEDQSPDHESSAIDVSSELEQQQQQFNTLHPPAVEVVSVDHRAPMDPASLSRSNVLYLNDYSLWTNAARAFCRDEAASSDRSEVEKRQERRDKRRERRGHERTVKAEEIEGYMGMRELKDLVEYIQGEERGGVVVGVAVSTGKRDKRKSETIATSLESKSVEVPPQRRLAVKQKSVGKGTPSEKLVENGDFVVKGVEVFVGTATEEGAEGGGTQDEMELLSDLPETASSSTELPELDTSENPPSEKDPGKTSTSKDPGKTTTRLDTPESEESTGKSSSKSAEKTEQILGHGTTKKSKKSSGRKNRGGSEIADKTQPGSRANNEIQNFNPQPTPCGDNSSETFPGVSESGALSEGELSADLHRHPQKSLDNAQVGEDNEWTVHTRRHPKNRTKQDDGESLRPSNEQYYPTAWKDPLGKPGFRRPEGRGGFGKVGGDGYQRFANPLGGRGRGLSVVESLGKVGSRTFWGSRESRDARENPRVFDTTGNSGKFPNLRSCVDEVECRKEESVTYARIAAGDPVWPPIVGQSGEVAGVEKVSTLGENSSGAKEVPIHIGNEEIYPPLEIIMLGDTKSTIQLEVAGTSGDLPSKSTAETSTVVLTAKEDQPSSGGTTMVLITTTKQIDTTSNGEGLTPSSKDVSRSSTIEVVDHSTGKGSSETNVVEAGNNIELTADRTEVKPGDGDPTGAGQTIPKSQPKRNPEPKSKALPVEFSRRFKGAKVDGISFCFDPTVSSDSDSRSQQGSSSTLESTSTSGGSISARLVSSGPGFSTTTVVPAGGGLQSQSSGSSVTNCSRPIAPLSGSGHASGAKTPVVVVNPMQVARGPAEPSQTIVTSDVDPEILKEVVVATGAVRIDATANVATAARIVAGTSCPVVPSKMDDGDGGMRVDTTRSPNETDVIQMKESPVLTGAGGKHVGETSGLTSIPRSQGSDPRPNPPLDTPQFFSPLVYAYVMCPQPAAVPSVYHQGVGPVPSDAAGPDRPQVLCQPRARETGPCVLTSPRLPGASLVLIQSYIHNEFQKVLEEEKHAPAKVVRYKDDSPNVA